MKELHQGEICETSETQNLVRSWVKEVGFWSDVFDE